MIKVDIRLNAFVVTGVRAVHDFSKVNQCSHVDSPCNPFDYRFRGFENTKLIIHVDQWAELLVRL